MKIIRAENAGFCFGVRRAMKLAFEAVAERAKPIYSLGPLIHNPQQVELLTRKGVHVVSELNSLKFGDTLIIRSHGTNPMMLEEAAAKGLRVVDATCPFVVKAQGLARHLTSEGYDVVIFGEGDHPEVIGLKGFAGDSAWVVEKAGDLDTLSLGSRVGVIAQTTQSFDSFREVVDALLKQIYELRVFNTICNATTHRQKAALDIARKVDLMIVIGGRNSANTGRLASLCAETGVRTYHIETADELEASWLEDVLIVGVTAGASTPEWIIKDVIDELEVLSRKNS